MDIEPDPICDMEPAPVCHIELAHTYLVKSETMSLYFEQEVQLA